MSIMVVSIGEGDTHMTCYDQSTYMFATATVMAGM